MCLHTVYFAYSKLDESKFSVKTNTFFSLRKDIFNVRYNQLV